MNRDPTLVSFSKRVGVVLVAAVAAISLIKALWMWTPVSIRSDLDAEAATRKTVDARLEVKLDRVLSVVELQAIIDDKSSTSEERAQALQQIHNMRRLVLQGD